jgi:hypothetical protein
VVTVEAITGTRSIDTMPRGDKSKYTEKQKRQAAHIEDGYERRSINPKTAARRAWATVNKAHGGGEKPGGSGYGKRVNSAPYIKGGKIGGKASARRSSAEKSASAKKAARTRARRRN